MTLLAERVRELLDYDSERGVFLWRVDRTGKAKIGAVAGALQSHGAIHIGIDGKVYLAHRLAWLWTYGEWPSSLDHINGDRSDNRLANLRLATASQNSGNRVVGRRNRSGYRGVSWHKGKQKWIAQISRAGRTKFVGMYETVEDAAAAVEVAGAELFGEFFNVRDDVRDLPDANGMVTFPVRLTADQERFLWDYSRLHSLGGRMAAIRALVVAAMRTAAA